MTEVATIQPDANASLWRLADALAGATSIIPTAYRGKPADIFLAAQLGSAMGLTPAESLYRIDVIGGKPTASAELIASNVRKAGHTLRVRADEAARSVTCEIVRHDDPDFVHSVTRDEAWAKQMGLLSKDNYKKQPLTMLQWRAITACARLACSEALYGVAYSPDEMGDLPVRPAATGLASVLAAKSAPAITEAEPARSADTDTAPALLDTSSDLAKAMFAALGEQGFKDREAKLEVCSGIAGRELASSSELTVAEAHLILDALTAAPVEDDQ